MESRDRLGEASGTREAKKEKEIYGQIESKEELKTRLEDSSATIEKDLKLFPPPIISAVDQRMPA